MGREVPLDIGLPEIEQLVDELQQPVGAVLDDAQVFVLLVVGLAVPHDVLQRSDDQGQRGSDLVRARQEVDPRPIEFVLPLVLDLPQVLAIPPPDADAVVVHREEEEGRRQQAVEDQRPHRAVERRSDLDSQRRLGYRPVAGADGGLHTEEVLAGTQLIIRSYCRR